MTPVYRRHRSDLVKDIFRHGGLMTKEVEYGIHCCTEFMFEVLHAPVKTKMHEIT